jgi:adsorption protein B
MVAFGHRQDYHRGIVDRLVAGLLVPLAMWVLASGLDDFLLDLLYFWWRLRRRRAGAPKELAPAREKRIALLIPAWREDAVIERMLDHNLAAIRYSNYEVFVGAYPNDLPTLNRLRACELRHSRVHVVLCPHDGPTSKADCLNWVYQGVLLFEEANGPRFELLLHHDAEDLIHPQSLNWINCYSERFEMVQVPVLPLPTPASELTHGVYCDEFAHSHGSELHVRVWRGGFLPSCGVGTAYRREALDRLAWNNDGNPLAPDVLTEDYLTGLELHRLGCSQTLLDLAALGDERGPGATREYFPRRFGSAVRQRARWIAGIALQGWERIGWSAGPGQWYWLWRDRKGLLGNPLTILANLVFLYGLAGWVQAWWSNETWGLGEAVAGSRILTGVLALNTGLIVWRQAIRATTTARYYGWRFAALAPLRSVWGNVVNFAATLRALRLFFGAKIRAEVPAWLKTEHCYPTNGALRSHRRRLGEVLVDLRILARDQLERALEARPPGERLGEYLVRIGAVSEIELYRAVGAQHTLEVAPIDASAISPEALERLPRPVAERWRVIPLRVTHERYLWLAGPELPGDQAEAELRSASGLEPRFQLMPPSDFAAVWRGLNWPAQKATASPQSYRHPRE